MKNLIFSLCVFCAAALVYPQTGSGEYAGITSDQPSVQQQKTGGSILGTVIDITERNPIDKATVEVLGTGIKVTTLKDGQFNITNVAQGFYQVRASAAGYDLQTQNNLYVEEGKPATAFLMLKKTGLQETSEGESNTPVPISTKSPNYPYEAKKNGVEGIFYFIIDVSETGSIVLVKCVERNVFAEYGKLKDKQAYDKYPQAVNQMEKEALESVWQWKFKPATREGKAIAARVTLPVKYKLSKD